MNNDVKNFFRWLRGEISFQPQSDNSSLSKKKGKVVAQVFDWPRTGVDYSKNPCMMLTRDQLEKQQEEEKKE